MCKHTFKGEVKLGKRERENNTECVCEFLLQTSREQIVVESLYYKLKKLIMVYPLSCPYVFLILLFCISSWFV